MSVRPSVCLTVQIRVRAITSLFFEVGIPYMAYGCITKRRCVTYIDDLCMTLTFDLNVKIISYQLFNMNSCPGHKFFVLCHRHPVFGTWMHHHATMYHVLCLSVRLFVLICVQAITSLFFDVRISYLAYGCINMRGCIAYIHDLHVTFDHMTLTFDLKVKGISFLTWIIFGILVYHHERMFH